MRKHYYHEPPSDKNPILKLNVPDGTNFFDIKAEDFELVDYEPVKPQLHLNWRFKLFISQCLMNRRASNLIVVDSNTTFCVVFKHVIQRAFSLKILLGISYL